MTDSQKEKLLAYAAEERIPDWAWDEVRCEGCGAVVSRDDAERLDHYWLCSECAAEVALIEEISR